MYEDFTLSAAQRGYKQPGKKLRPRDAYAAMERDSRGLHSMRELRSLFAAELEAYGWKSPPHIRKFDKLRDALNGRQKRKLEKLLVRSEMHMCRPFGQRRLCRAFDAAYEMSNIEECIAADNRMWANAQ